jgi:RHS repeat-associated protein
MAIAGITSSAPTRGFGELFAEGKGKLDSLQASMASILPSFPGMPVGKYFDLAIGIDFEPTIAPPCPIFPVPHIGMVFDIMGAIMSAIASLMPPPPPPPAEGEEAEVSVMSIATAVVNAMKPSVKVHGQWVNNAGTGIQHLPGIIVHLLPLAKPMASSEMWMGSSTVLADGGPCSTQFHPALSCNLVGFPSLFRMNKPPRPKIALMAPTSMLLVITSAGKPVLAGGPPTIDLFQLMFKMGLKGMAKSWKKLGDRFQKLIDDIKAKSPQLANILQAAKCRMFGEPVDAATGRVYAHNTDFELAGPIPLTWDRYYYSDAQVEGPLGSNWHHSYNMGLYNMANGYFTLRLSDGRETVLPHLHMGEIFYSRKEKLYFQKDAEGYFVTDTSKLMYRFNGPKNKEGYATLSTISNAAGFAIQFFYNSKGALQQIIDSCGRILQVEADELGRVLHVYSNHAENEITFIAYRYDASGNMIHTQDAAGAEKHFYYDGHLLTRLTNQSGMNFYWEYEGKGDNAKCIHTWGDGGVLEYWTQYEEGKTTTTNSLGHTTQYFYDAKKLIYKIIDANGGITRQLYNDFEELVSVINPEGGVQQYQYNQNGKPTRLVNENDESTTYTYDEKQNITSINSPGGMSLSYKYDEQNRIIEKRNASGNTLYYQYEGKYLKHITDNKKRSFTLSYNEQHNITHLLYPNKLQQHWHYDAWGNVLATTDVRGNTTHYKYNNAGQVIWLKEADGNQHQFAYDTSGNMIKAEDASHLVEFAYGALGILLGRTQNGRSVNFNYDNELQLRSIANEGGEVYKFGLDPMGNVVNEWGFDGLHRRYLRDGNGRVQKVLRPAERWTTYNYDSVGNILKEEHSDGSLTAYKYNADGLLTEAFNEHSHILLKRDGAGRIITEKQGEYTVTKKYDEDGNCVHTGSSLGADVKMEYDEWGLLKNMQTEGWQTLLQHDDNGLELYRELTGNVQVTTERDNLGRVTRRSIGAHNVEQSRHRYEWSKGNKLNKIINELSNAKTNFEYDAFDNLISGTYNEAGKTETIYRVPDKIGNLFKTKERSDRKYGKGGQLQQDEKYNYYYDGEGNLLLKEFRSNPNERTEDKTAYAAERKIILKGSATGWAYKWAGNGMLKQVINPGGATVEFHYDPLGRRVAKEYKGTVTRWVWNGNTPLHEWNYKGQYPPHTSIDEDGTITEEREPVENIITWIFEDESFVPCAKIDEKKKYSIVTDYLGTATHGYDAEGKIVWERELDCYGKSRKQKGAKDFCPYLYQGQYLDDETGLAYNRFRYYDVDSGGYISQDPIGLNGGTAFYGFVHDPNSHVDIFGWWSELLPSGMGHHLFPRSVAKKLAIPELSQNNSISWYPNNPKGSDVLHGEMHGALSKEGIPFHGSKFEGTSADAFEKMKKAYEGFDQKGFLKIPGTSEKLFKNLTPGEAIDKIRELHESGKLKSNH